MDRTVAKDNALAGTRLELRNVTLGYGARVLLREVSFAMPERGLVALLGPSGVGKSTLLRAIGRRNDSQPSFWIRGSILLNREDLLQQKAGQIQFQIPILIQKARLYTGSVLDNLLIGANLPATAGPGIKEEYAHSILAPWQLWDEFAGRLSEPVLNLSVAAHKKILLSRLLAPPQVSCLLVDEPLREVAVAEENALSELLWRMARRYPVLMVTHSKPAAREISQMVCFVSGDRLVEATPSDVFFSCPRTELGREFLQSGSSWPLLPAESPPAADEKALPAVPSAALHPPYEFHWILMGLLGGTHRPGLWGDINHDLYGLQKLGIRILVTLTEDPFEHSRLAAFGIDSVHFPIIDMSIPNMQAARAICTRISSWIDRGQPTALHCKAGLGRTGTMLACILVYRGMEPVRAIEMVRSIQSGYIQTEQQLAFVGAFADDLCQSH